MNKKIIIAFICFLCPGIVSSQWIGQEVPVDTGIMLSIDFTSSNTGISGGGKFGAKPRARALYTTNSGSNWLLATDPDSARAYVAVQLFDSQNGYMSGAYNSTVNLTSAVNPTSGYNKKYYEQILNRQKENGVEGFPDYRAMLLKTTDHGQTWNTYGVIPEKYTYSQDMDFFDMNTGYMVASIQDLSTFRSGILRTTNSGLTWSELLSLPIDGSLNSVVCTGAERVFVTGAEIRNDSLFGVIMKSTNAGFSWEINYYPDITFEDVFFTNASTGFVVGSNETEQSFIYRTTDSGSSWSLMHTMEETKLKSISFFEGSGTGIVCGITSPVLMNAPYLSRTSDYGATWETQTLSLDDGIVLIGADLLSSVNGFVSGTDCILKTTNGGSVSIHQSSETSPYKFTLSQNYPNPFNPNTKINYELRITNYVSLKVFDVLGNEVRTLVNQKQNAGGYQVDFDGSGLSSGIYFYTLKTDGFSETKRMTLLK